MKVGIITQPNAKGQIVIPKKIRDTLGITAQTNLQITMQGNSVTITPVKVIADISAVNEYNNKKKLRKPGLWKGKVWMSDDFNDEDEEINKMFYEGEIFPEK